MNNEPTQKELESEITELKKQLEHKREKLKILKFINTNRRYYLNWDGSIHEMALTINVTTKESGIKQGNVFKTIEDAEKDRDRRALLYEFNQFKNEQNNGWAPNWKDYNEPKFYITFSENNELKPSYMSTLQTFVTFGYFNDYRACFDAIQKFGDRIKKLYID
jgi:hypothetical protein